MQQLLSSFSTNNELWKTVTSNALCHHDGLLKKQWTLNETRFETVYEYTQLSK